MKRKILASVLMHALLFVGCVNRIDNDPSDIADLGKKEVVFSTRLSITQTPMKTKTISNQASRLTMAIFQDGIEEKKIEQSLPDDNFGKFSTTLDYGDYELFFIGHNSENETLSYPTVSFGKITDTFSYYTAMSINKSTNPIQSIELDRSVGLLKIVAEDAIPSNISSLKIKLSKYYPILNVKTSLAEGLPESTERTFEYTIEHIGAKGSKYSIYSFSPENGFKTDISISSIDSNGNIIHTINMSDIPIEKNRQTILSGNIFQSDMDLNISINDQWGENIEMPI